MRVTTQTAVGTLLTNLDRSYRRITRYQAELSSGTRLNKISDDPAAVERSLALRSELRNVEQFQKNIDDGTGWLQLSEVTLSELESVFVQARGLAVQGARSTYNGAQRNAIADQIDQSLEHVLTLSGARYRGRYIFSGTRTSQVPFTARRDADGNILAVTSNGDISGSIDREIADGIVMRVNVPGNEVFGDPARIVVPLGKLPDDMDPDDAADLDTLFGDDHQLTLDELQARLDDAVPGSPALSSGARAYLIQLRDRYAQHQTNPFDALIGLRDALRTGEAERVRGALDHLEVVQDRISSVRGEVGARVNRMQTTRNVLDRVSDEMTRILSDDEDVDLSTAVVNLRQEQDVYQAALSSGTGLIPQTLMDFI